jgi:hypothetical protein
MGSNNGTGQPYWFMCWRMRRDKGATRSATRWEWEHHTVTRTGRTRPKRNNKGGARVLQQEHEYTCTCGHRGWTRHVDILRTPTSYP